MNTFVFSHDQYVAGDTDSMTSQRYTSRLAVYLVLVNEQGEVLLSLRQNTGYADGCYSLVAGHVDANETIQESMIREAREEACITLQKDQFSGLCVMHRRSVDYPYVDFFLAVRNWRGEFQNNEPHKCGALSFYPLDQLPPNTLYHVRRGIAAVLSGERYLEIGWDHPAIS